MDYKFSCLDCKEKTRWSDEEVRNVVLAKMFGKINAVSVLYLEFCAKQKHMMVYICYQISGKGKSLKLATCLCLPIHLLLLLPSLHNAHITMGNK